MHNFETIKNNLVAVGIKDGDTLLLRIIQTIEKKLVTPNPEILLCSNPYCWKCRLSYSYSDTNIIKFF